MLDEMMQALDDDNGIIEETWIRILMTVGDKDPSVSCVSSYGGRYYVTNAQRSRLKHMIPFMMGDATYIKPKPQLALPPHVEPGPLRCSKCKGPFHPATGHQFTDVIVACHVCYGRFAAWQMQKYGWRPLTTKEAKRLTKKKNKAARKAAKAEKAIAKQLLEKAAEKEKLYGKPRDAQTAPMNPILER